MAADERTDPVLTPARTSGWGGAEAWAELRRIAEDARARAGFRVSAIEVLRTDGLLELVAFTGRPEEVADVGGAFALRHVRRVLEEGTRYGWLVFLAEEDMDRELQDAVRGYGYVPDVADTGDSGQWRALDMLVAHVTDATGRTRALLHLDEPLSGRRPLPAELWAMTEDLDLLVRAVLATVDREELTRQARLDETARAVVRAASGRSGEELLAHVHAELVAGFRAISVAVLLHDQPDGAAGRGAAATLPEGVRAGVEAASRRAWESRDVVVVEPGRVWGDDRLDRDHREQLTEHLARHRAGELLLVPVGAGHESMGVLVVVRRGMENRWTEGESHAALGVGHDLGRALLSTRAHEREQHLIEQLRRLDDYRSQLIATLAHELKNPLGVIVGHLEMLESIPGLPAPAETSLRALDRSAGRMTSVVEDLLMLSRIGNPDNPAVALPVDLGVVLAEVVEDESLRAAAHHVVMRCQTPEGPVVVPGEPEELRRLVANLVSNAVKYSRDGGRVDLGLTRRETEVVFSCADDGLGISEEDRPRLFTEFFRSTNPEALHRPGTGLGLAIVSRIVARHGGRIEVETRLGLGTTVEVTLPV